MPDRKILIDRLIEIYGSRDAANRWLDTPHAQLDGKSPLAVIAAKVSGMSRVHDLLDAEETVAAAAEFLCDRLDGFDASDPDSVRDYIGHVAPALSRLKAALAKARDHA